jgi:predicted RNA-binding protein with PIN domain
MTEQHVIFGKGAFRVPAGELLVKIRLSRREIHQKIREDTPSKRNTFDSKLTSEMKDLFEKWRRGQ